MDCGMASQTINIRYHNNHPLAAALRARGLTVTALAGLLGVHRITVHRWLAGRVPTPVLITRICALTGLTPADFYPGAVRDAAPHLTAPDPAAVFLSEPA
jgi:transcriptional regulator with XRE-family HTH domain